jgi:acyl-CoA thioester hydrolase
LTDDASDYTAPLCTESEIVARYAETDKMGVVYHANYLVWMEVGRTDYLARLGFPYGRLELDGVLFPAVEAGIKLNGSCYYEDRLSVLTTLESLRSRKVAFSYRVVRDGEVLVEGRTEHVCVDGQMKVRKIPQPLFEALKSSMNGGR